MEYIVGSVWILTFLTMFILTLKVFKYLKKRNELDSALFEALDIEVKEENEIID